MRDLDPQLMRLREVEARIALAEFHVREQQDVVARLDAGGLDAKLAGDLLASMRRTLELFRERQALILSEMTRHNPADPECHLKPPHVGNHVAGVEFEVRVDGRNVECFVAKDVLVDCFGATADDPPALLQAFALHDREIEAVATRRARVPHGRVVVITHASVSSGALAGVSHASGSLQSPPASRHPARGQKIVRSE